MTEAALAAGRHQQGGGGGGGGGGASEAEAAEAADDLLSLSAFEKLEVLGEGSFGKVSG